MFRIYYNLDYLLFTSLLSIAVNVATFVGELVFYYFRSPVTRCGKRGTAGNVVKQAANLCLSSDNSIWRSIDMV